MDQWRAVILFDLNAGLAALRESIISMRSRGPCGIDDIDKMLAGINPNELPNEVLVCLLACTAAAARALHHRRGLYQRVAEKMGVQHPDLMGLACEEGW